MCRRHGPKGTAVQRAIVDDLESAFVEHGVKSPESNALPEGAEVVRTGGRPQP